MSLPIGLQLYTVREKLAEDLDSTIHAVAEIGYKNVEHCDGFNFTTEQLAKLCDKLGMKIIASHVNINNLEDPADFDRLVGESKDYGFKHIVCSHIIPNERSEDQLRAFPGRLNVPARKLADAGITVSFHNHEHEFVDQVDGKRLWDHLLNEFDPACVGFELDIAWLDFAKEDPAQWINQLAGRAPLIHIKDHNGQPNDGGRATFAEVGTGVVDIPAAVKAAETNGSQYLIIEQDRYWIDDNPIKSAKISFENLSKIVQP